MNFLEINENKFFEIIELIGQYKVDHKTKQVKAYRKTKGGRMMYDGVVNGLYESLTVGRWRIK